MARTEAVAAGQVRKATQAEIIAAIENGIASGEFRPNERMDERELAHRFGVSRTPVREALNRIATSGLIESRPNQGMFVSAMSLPEFLQMYEVLGDLEALCARLAARRMTPDEKQELVRIHAEGEQAAGAVNPAAYADHNWRFHSAIYDGAHNEFLSNTIRQLRRRVDPYRRFSFQIPRRTVESHAEHGRIVELIVSGDAEGASQVMREHMDLQRSNFADFMVLLTRNFPNA